MRRKRTSVCDSRCTLRAWAGFRRVFDRAALVAVLGPSATASLYEQECLRRVERPGRFARCFAATHKRILLRKRALTCGPDPVTRATCSGLSIRSCARPPPMTTVGTALDAPTCLCVARSRLTLGLGIARPTFVDPGRSWRLLERTLPVLRIAAPLLRAPARRARLLARVVPVAPVRPRRAPSSRARLRGRPAICSPLCAA